MARRTRAAFRAIEAEVAGYTDTPGDDLYADDVMHLLKMVDEETAVRGKKVVANLFRKPRTLALLNKWGLAFHDDGDPSSEMFRIMRGDEPLLWYGVHTYRFAQCVTLRDWLDETRVQLIDGEPCVQATQSEVDSGINLEDRLVAG